MREIQSDAAQSLAALAEQLSMAQSTLWRRLNDLESAGVITARVAVLDPNKVGADLCVFASVSLHDHSEAAVADFASIIRAHPEILECHAVSGNADYILKIRVADVAAYERFMTHVLLRNKHVQAVHSSFSLRQLKSTTALPV